MSDFRAVGQRLSNWGRWGPDDQIGTVNLVGAEQVRAAAALVRRGAVFDLGIAIGADGPQVGLGGRINPVHLMSMTGDPRFPDGGGVADDFIFMPLQAATQWDGLAHCFYDDRCYNDVPVSTITARLGATRLGIDHLAKGVIGRAVLVDIARLHGVEHLAASQPITPADLDAALARQDVTMHPGDILLVRTGWRQVCTQVSAAEFMASEPGLTLECCEWLHERDVAAVASDNWAVEVLPSGDDHARIPLHYVLIRDMGMTLGEMFDLEDLAADCAADGVWECFFTAPVLKITNAVGTPINPLAIK